MINNILLNGKIVNLEDVVLNEVHTMTITRVWFEGDKVNLTTESFPFNKEEFEVLKNEAYDNAVKFVSIMAERQKANEVVIPTVEETPFVEQPVVEETLYERIAKETHAGPIWVSRAMQASNGNYESSLQYLFERGLYNKPQNIVVEKKVEVPAEENKDETLFDKLLKETSAGTIWVLRAMEASKDDYEGSLRFLAEKGLYDASKIPTKKEEQLVMEPVVIAKEPVVTVEEPLVIQEQKSAPVTNDLPIIDVEIKPAKKKVAGKIIKYGLAAAIFIGGFSLVKDFLGNQKLSITNEPNTNEFIEQSVVEHNITSAEFLTKSVELSDYLNSKGLKTSANEIYSTLYLANMTYFEPTVIDELTNDELKILSKSSKTMIEDSLGFLAEVDTFNNNIIENSEMISEEVLADRLISLQGFILSNPNDLENLRHMENELINIAKPDKSDDRAQKYLNIFDYFSGSVKTDFPHTSSEGSIGGRYLQKTVGSQVNQFARHFMDKNALQSFETPITDLTNEIGYLNDCGFSFNTFTK